MPQAQNKSAKGNPAHVRMANKHRKEYRASLWARQERRKELRRREQAKRHAENVANGYPVSPWQTQRDNRFISVDRREKRERFYRLSDVSDGE